MKVAFPTDSLNGLDSKVFGHFGSAPGFVIVDSDTMEFEQIQNRDQHHAHGGCQPLKALDGRAVDGVVVGGIGGGALRKLQAQGIIVYKANPGSVSDLIAQLKDKKLPVFALTDTCAGHSHAGGCSHH